MFCLRGDAVSNETISAVGTQGGGLPILATGTQRDNTKVGWLLQPIAPAIPHPSAIPVKPTFPQQEGEGKGGRGELVQKFAFTHDASYSAIERRNFSYVRSFNFWTSWIESPPMPPVC